MIIMCVALRVSLVFLKTTTLLTLATICSLKYPGLAYCTAVGCTPGVGTTEMSLLEWLKKSKGMTALFFSKGVLNC